ncbi:TetR/AcrR family transcriptional regulator [Hydrogenophilus thermoluteolus]|uniref:TetR/AcrR family transcriptional regulator n=1 Tax=Hydrogenophilus thermoluteolus TaxID=297 RepID=UPI001C63CD90|nr:TetR/AcrR family transcriptional regulator [Hydrogenophilus thermoluteolus]MBW7657709.1 TetR/AcrR family transcriptional regulator [Hydrogenophilus thermoluteolus]
MKKLENVAAAASPYKRRRRRKEARPQELLEAAMALFIERGYAATRLEDVAARAGVVKGTIYLYYADKLALFTAVVEQVIAPLLGEDEQWLTEGVPSDAAPFDRLWLLLERWGERLFHTPLGGLAKLVMAEASNFPEMATVYHDRVIHPAMALVERVIIDGQKRGDFPVTLQPKATARLVVAPLLQRSLWLSSFAVVCSEASEALDEAVFWANYRLLLRDGLLRRVE